MGSTTKNVKQNDRIDELTRLWVIQTDIMLMKIVQGINYSNMHSEHIGTVKNKKSVSRRTVDITLRYSSIWLPGPGGGSLVTPTVDRFRSEVWAFVF